MDARRGTPGTPRWRVRAFPVLAGEPKLLAQLESAYLAVVPPDCRSFPAAAKKRGGMLMSRPHSRSGPRLGFATCGELEDGKSAGAAAFVAGIRSALGPGQTTAARGRERRRGWEGGPQPVRGWIPAPSRRER